MKYAELLGPGDAGALRRCHRRHPRQIDHHRHDRFRPLATAASTPASSSAEPCRNSAAEATRASAGSSWPRPASSTAASITCDPRVAIITNIEEDHLDCYKNIDEIVESFRSFAALVPADGLLIVNGDDANVARGARKASTRRCRPSRSTTLPPGCTTILGNEQGCYLGRVAFDGAAGRRAPPLGRRRAQSLQRDRRGRRLRRLRSRSARAR